MKSNRLTKLEEKLLEAIIRPSLSEEKNDKSYSYDTSSQSLNFVYLLKNVQAFYRENGGTDWARVVLESEA